jgi:3-phosphoshikimate 1-carboxyvinyltransferase
MRFLVETSTLSGEISVTTSKSHTMRAILLAAMAEGRSRVRHPLPSPDAAAMITACRALGANITEHTDELEIVGTGGTLRTPPDVIDVGNSGQVLRFGAAMAARLPLYTVFTGDSSVRAIRPMQPLLDALNALGAFAASTKGDGKAPIIVRGPVRAGRVRMDGADSQPVSAMLMLAACLDGSTEIEVDNPGETPWIDMTLYWLDKLGVEYEHRDYARYRVTGRGVWPGFDYAVPGDWSSAAFPLAAALVTGSEITLRNMDIRDPQGDKAVLDIFRRMGADIAVDEAARTVAVRRCAGLHGIEVDVNAAIDALPVLAAVACFADSPTTITGAAIARRKESDRIAAISAELGKMGANISEFGDGLTVCPAKLHGAETESRHDHRIAMSLAVAGLACGGTVVHDAACAAKSFPGFASAMQGLGANINEEADGANT